MVWLDEIGGVVALGARTGYEVALYLDWFEYLKKVSERSGVSIAGAYTVYTQAVNYARALNFGVAYPKAVEAVRLGRDTLKRNYPTLRVATDGLRNEISALLSGAQREGINISWAFSPLTIASGLYNGGDYTAAFDVHYSLRDDVRNYIANARAGRPVGRLSGTYDIPAGTTDIITLDYLNTEGAGWLQQWYSAGASLEQIRRAIREQAPEAEVIGYKVVPPRIIIFVRSPIAPLIAAIILAVLATVLVTMAALAFIYRAQADAKIAEEKRNIDDNRADFYNKAYDDLRDGKISQDTFDDVTGNYDEGYKAMVESFEQKGMDLMGLLMMIIPVGIAVMVLGWFLQRK